MNDSISHFHTQQKSGKKKSRQQQRPQLGRGLNALFGESDVSVDVSSAVSLSGSVTGETTLQEGGLRFLSVDALLPGPFQPRQNIEPTLLQELVESIQEHGVLQPILVRSHPEKPDHYQIIAGERRWRAAVMAQCQTVPVYVRDLSESDAKIAALVENLQRADLNPIEEAEGLNRLLEDHHLSQEALARAVGKSRPHVANMLRLLRLPAGVQTQLKKGALSAGHARALLTHPDPVSAAAEVISKALSVRQTEVLVQKALRQAKESVKKEDNPLSRSEILALERDLCHQLGLKVSVTCYGQKGGSLKIHYKNFEQLEALLTLLKNKT